MSHSTAEIIPLHRPFWPEIRAAAVHSSGARIAGSRSEVWLCPAYSGADTVMLFVKPALTIRQLVAELVAAQVGHCLGLPCAPPFLVSIAPHHVNRPRGPALLAFGCQQVGPSAAAYPVRNLSLMLEMLRKAKIAEGVCVLDEWIANSVRGPGDIVFDPHHAVWLIDHEEAFEAHVRPDEAVTNWLAQQLTAMLTTRSQRTEFLARLHARGFAAANTPLGRMPPELHDVAGGQATYGAVLEFLAARLKRLGDLLGARVMPQQQSIDLQNPSDDSASVA
jgi:hypothetical protein